MVLVYIALLVLVVAVVWIAGRAVTRRAPAPPTAANVVQSAPGERGARGVEEALALLATCVQPRGTGNLTSLVQLRISDHVPADWQLELAQGTCTLIRGQANGAQLTLTASSQTWSELAAKRVGFAQAAMKGTLQSAGDTAILMRLDDEFSGSPDPSRLSLAPDLQAGSDSRPLEESPTAATYVEGAAHNPLIEQRQMLLAAIKAAKADPNQSPTERRAAMIDALRKSLGPGTDVQVDPSGSIDATFAPSGSASNPMHAGHDVREAIHQAIRELPPGATREQKLAAVQLAIQNMPAAGRLAAGSHQAAGGELAGVVLEGLLEGLFGG